MDALKKPKTPDVVPTDHFRRDEVEKIISATYKYDFGGGKDSQFRGLRLRAMSLLNGLNTTFNKPRGKSWKGSPS